MTPTHGTMMADSPPNISTLTPEELLGPLNDVEQRYAPKMLHVAGIQTFPLPKPRVAIVGSRKASSNAIKTTSSIAKTLVKNGVIIVSGLAEGIDTAAHVAAIGNQGRTIAVLGTPLDRTFPAKNHTLQQAIMRHHWAVSQFPSSHPTTPKDFVLRNRTMALIANASIIIEAGETSGSLHQGWEALRLGRPLFIWKTLIENPKLSWPRKMIDYGALVLKKPDDVLNNLPSSGQVILVPKS